MALATTCPQCKTSFKVIPDQLKLRRGLVRCGVCQHVFSGIDYLRYVDESGKSKPVGPVANATPGESAAAPTRDRPTGLASKSESDRGNTRIGAANAPASPQTVIAADDELKTAFFLSDSTFGPFTQARPVDSTPSTPIGSPVLPQTTGDFARDFVNEGTTRIGPHQPSPAPSGSRSGTPARTTGGIASAPSPGAPTAASAPATSAAPGGSAASGSSATARAGTASARQTSSADAATSATGAASTATATRSGTSARTTTRSPAPVDDFEAPAPRRSGRRSLLEDDDDAEVAAANSLARQAREAARSRQGSRSGRRRSGEAAGEFNDLGAYFSDTRRTGLVIGLSALLLLQLLLAFRGEIVSRAPSLRPALEIVSGIFGMNVESVRSLSSLTIESFDLQNTARPDQIALNAVLRNRDGFAVRWPAMVLTLSDPAGAVVVRKVILPSDYLNRSAPREGLSGRSEWPVRLLLDTGTMQLAGYSVALFYP